MNYKARQQASLNIDDALSDDLEKPTFFLRFTSLPLLVSCTNFSILNPLKATFLVYTFSNYRSPHSNPHPPSPEKVFFSLTSNFSSQTFDKSCPSTDKHCFCCQPAGFTSARLVVNLMSACWKRMFRPAWLFSEH